MQGRRYRVLLTTMWSDGATMLRSQAFCAEMVYEVLGFDILILDCNEHERTTCAKLVGAFANEQEQPKARTEESSLLA